MGKRREGARFKHHLRELDGPAALGLTDAIETVLQTHQQPAEPDALTGALKPPPLAELSELLGVQVIAARRLGGYRDGRLTDEGSTWRLVMPGAPIASAEITTRHLRSPFWLNRMAAYWGRAPGASELVKADCRRALRLLHEYVETNDATTLTESER